MDFLFSWLYKTWFSMPRSDYAILVLITLLINILGFLQGVGIGLALAVVLFVIQYSRTQAVRHTLSGVSYQSSVDRARLDTQLLQHYGNWLYILELQGFIFFGTANQILEEIRSHLEASDCFQPPRFIILDFRLVSGVDSSATFSFAKIKRLTQAHGIELILTNSTPGIEKQLKRDLAANSFYFFPDLDHGIEWCENQMVAEFEKEGQLIHGGSLFQQLAETLPDKEQVSILQQYLKLRHVDEAECIIKQGCAQKGLYMIESGQVVIQIKCGDGSSLRLRTLGAGAFFGEMGLYSKEPASADVVAEKPSNLYVLMADDLAKLEQVAPAVAASLHRFVAVYMSERLAKITATVQAMR
jgi:SulP family sulfate permease